METKLSPEDRAAARAFFSTGPGTRFLSILKQDRTRVLSPEKMEGLDQSKIALLAAYRQGGEDKMEALESLILSDQTHEDSDHVNFADR